MRLAVRSARSSRAGFTLIELVVYLALLVAGTIVIAGLEFTASRAAFLERALVDLGIQGDEMGLRFKEDIAQAVRVEEGKLDNKAGALLILATASGGEVRWELESAKKVERTGPALRAEGVRLVRRVFVKPGTTPSRVEVFGLVDKLLLTRSGTSVRLDATLAVSRGDEVTARRSFQFAASPVAEEAP